MLNAKNLYVLNQITNIAVMIVLITIKTQWNALVLLTLRNADMMQIDAFNYSNSFTVFNDIQKQRLLETKQPPFRMN